MKVTSFNPIQEEVNESAHDHESVQPKFVQSQSGIFNPNLNQHTQNIPTQQSRHFDNSNKFALSQSMLNYGKEEEEYPKIIPSTIKSDERFTSYDLQMPIKYYYDKVKFQEPSEKKENNWYLRPHHIESFSKNEKALPDDVLNTKYISYYGPANIPKPKTSQEELDEIIDKIREKREKLQFDLNTKICRDKNFGKFNKSGEQLESTFKKDYKPGMILDKLGPPKGKGTDDMFEGDVQYSEMFNNDDNVYRKNLVIDSYKYLIDDMRENEGKITVKKRKQEFERIRPPKDKWWEEKSKDFTGELQRNKMILNAQPEYFIKLKELQDENLY